VEAEQPAQPEQLEQPDKDPDLPDLSTEKTVVLRRQGSA
jgi:hypothetical protein